MALQISIRESGDVTILDLQGRSTLNNGESESLGRQIRDLVSKGKLKLLLNLADLVQVDSSAIGVIVEAYISVDRKGGQLKLLAPRGRVREVLKVFRLLDVLPNFEDETQALASFGPQDCPATA
jgi:anti-anti-sigma factor